MKSSRITVALLSLVAALTLSACGNKHAPDPATGQKVSGAETEGIYVDVDKLKYQVQTSKQLNPQLPEDRDYLEGVAGSELQLADDEVWFAVLMRVQNDEDSHDPIRSTNDFSIVDTQENVFTPVALGPNNNFAYREAVLPGGEVYPISDSTPGERPPYGALLLFKMTRTSLANRPLELIVKSRTSEQEAKINLDV